MAKGPVATEQRMSGPPWLGGYTLRRSRRAKRVLLKISGDRRLTAVIPWSFRTRRLAAYLDELLESRRGWIESTLRKREELRRALGSEQAPWPAEIVFPALERAWPVLYETGPGPGARWRLVEGGLRVSSPDWERAAGALVAFGRSRAKAELPVWLGRLAEEQGLALSRVSIRGQRSRWGSCSRRGALSLNWKLLFLPPALCRYVLLHELAHLKHLNHSPAYWAELHSWEPAALELDRELRQGWAHVPAWAE